MTLAFETRNGQRGLLQITDLNDNPRSVTIRYQLLQDSREAKVLEKISFHSATGREVGACGMKIFWKNTHRSKRCWKNEP